MSAAGRRASAPRWRRASRTPRPRSSCINDESVEPYEKPPLSKAVLTGKAMPQDAPIAGPKGVAGANVTLKPARVREIDSAGRAVVTEAGERIPYDALVLATGSRNRILPMFPEGQPGIYYLRTADEALALKAHLGLAKSLLLIGGGVVGLEIAASAAELGIKVTVIEIAPRILARVCDEETSAIIHQRHRDSRRRYPHRHGLRRLAGAAGRQARGRDQGRRNACRRSHRRRRRRGARRRAGEKRGARACRTASWSTTAAAPPIPRSSPPATARASPAPTVRCGWRTGGTRRSTAPWPAATRRAATPPTIAVPSYWSEQYDLYIQGMGWPVAQPSARVRRKISDKATLLFELDGAHDRLCDRHQCAARHRDHPPADRAARSRSTRRSLPIPRSR